MLLQPILCHDASVSGNRSLPGNRISIRDCACAISPKREEDASNLNHNLNHRPTIRLFRPRARLSLPHRFVIRFLCAARILNGDICILMYTRPCFTPDLRFLLSSRAVCGLHNIAELPDRLLQSIANVHGKHHSQMENVERLATANETQYGWVETSHQNLTSRNHRHQHRQCSP